MGNVRISEAEQDDFADKLVVDIVGPTILAGSVTYIGDGQSEAESAPAPRMDFLVESAAGDTGSFAIAAKDAYSNDLRTGGDEFSVLLTHREDADAQYRAPFWWERAYDGVDVYKSPDYCDHAQPILEVVHGPLHAPTSSVIGPGVTEAMISGVKSKLTVQARDAFGNLRRGDDTTHFQYGYYGGETDQMGASDYFLVVFQHMTMDYAVTTSTAIQTVRIGNALTRARRRRGNPRRGKENVRESFEGGTYRLAFAGGKTLELPLNATAAALESAREKAHDDAVDVSVSRQDFAAGFGADHEYTITFLSDLDAWASDSLKVLSPEDGNGAAVAEVNISRPAAGGHYPVDFILGYVGEYELSVTSSGRHVEGSPFEVDCEHGVATSGATTVASDNINEAVAGDTIVLDVHARDHRQHEVQIVAVAAQAVDTVPEVHEVTKGDAPYVREIQTFYCDATSGNLAVDFRDYDTTASLDVSTATVADLATELAAVGIAVSAWRHDDKTDSALTICGSGNTVAEMVYVEFLELTGDLPALEYNASSTALASSIVAYSGGNYGQVDGVHPVWGTFTLEFGGWTSDPIRADASADELRDSLEALPSIGDVSVYKTTIGQCLDQLDRQIFPNASRLSAAPTVRVTEAIKGTTGNLVTSSGGDEIIEYSATHQQHTDVGIDMYETQRLRCDPVRRQLLLSMLNNATGLWETTTNVTGLTNIANLKAALLALPGVKPGLTVTGGNANGDICCTDATASTRGVDLEIEEIVKGIDSLEYAGDGLYRLSGARPLRQPPGPVLDAGPGSHFAVDLNGTGFEGGGREGDRSLVAGAVDDKYVPNTDGLYEASYTPELAGPHVLEVELTQPGGLLATYYAQMDFVDPALHATGWRVALPRAQVVPAGGVDALRQHAPRRAPGPRLRRPRAAVADGGPDFPRTSSPRWVGHLLGPVDGVVTLHLRTTEAVSLVLDGETLIDTMDASGSLVDAASANFTATKNELYALEISFVEEIDGAAISFEWTVGGAQAVVPASALYYTRHAKLSPETVVVYPDRIAAGDDGGAEGDGTLACVALEECSFVVTATDADGNYRVNTGADELVVEILGVGDWAGEGRTNEYDSYGVIEVDEVTDVNVAWDYVGTASVYNNVSKLYNLSGAFETLLRGDVLSIGDGDLQDASPEFIAIGSGAFYLNDTVGADERSVPSRTSGAERRAPSVYKGAYAGDTARHTISYTPYVRGTYDLDVRVKKTEEVQQVVVSVGAGLCAGKKLAGNFTLSLTAPDKFGVVATETTPPIAYDATPQDVEDALITLSQVWACNVSGYNSAKNGSKFRRVQRRREQVLRVGLCGNDDAGRDGWSRKNSDGLVASTATAVNGSVAYVGDGERRVLHARGLGPDDRRRRAAGRRRAGRLLERHGPDDAVKDGGGVVFSIAGAPPTRSPGTPRRPTSPRRSRARLGRRRVSRGIARGTDDLSKYDAAALRGLQIDSVNYVYSVTFSDYVGDVPPIEAHFPLDANFIDYASASVAEVVKGSWGVVKASESKITATPWVNEALVREKQVVRLVGSGSHDGNFTLSSRTRRRA
ncbi:hypothetical protein JL722_12146 [Aureococcus anophagefferens]|nr:hypothetical protein JL722_12146 [Aureococcus anophagefferens]